MKARPNKQKKPRDSPKNPKDSPKNPKKTKSPQENELRLRAVFGEISRLLPPVGEVENPTEERLKVLAANFAMLTMRDASLQVGRQLAMRGYGIGPLVTTHQVFGILMGCLELIAEADSPTETKAIAAEELLTLAPESIQNLLPDFCAKTLGVAKRYFQNPSSNTPAPKERP